MQPSDVKESRGRSSFSDFGHDFTLPAASLGHSYSTLQLFVEAFFYFLNFAFRQASTYLDFFLDQFVKPLAKQEHSGSTAVVYGRI